MVTLFLALAICAAAATLCVRALSHYLFAAALALVFSVAALFASLPLWGSVGL
jgi:hypothetical protein